MKRYVTCRVLDTVPQPGTDSTTTPGSGLATVAHAAAPKPQADEPCPSSATRRHKPILDVIQSLVDRAYGDAAETQGRMLNITI